MLVIKQHYSMASQTFMQISSNGLISFRRPVTEGHPVLFPGSSQYRNLVAPFWAKHNTSYSGHIAYEIHTLSNGTALMSTINTYINTKLDNNFKGTWLLLVEWKDIPLDGDQALKVSYVSCRKKA